MTMNEKENFLDKNTLLAIAFTLLCWLAWDFYMKKKYPKQLEKSPSKTSVVSYPSSPSNSHSSNSFSAPSDRKKKLVPQLRKEKILTYKSSSLSFGLSSRGMGFKNVQLNQVLDRSNQPVLLSSSNEGVEKIFETHIIYLSDSLSEETLNFELSQLGKHFFEGRAEVFGLKIRKTLKVFPEEFLIKTQVKISGDLSQIKGVKTFLPAFKPLFFQRSGIFSFLSQPDFMSFFLFSNSEGVQRFSLFHDADDRGKHHVSTPTVSGVQLAGVGTKYFGQAFIDDSDVQADFNFVYKNQWLSGVLFHPVINRQESFVTSYRLFMGPKSLRLLKKHDLQLVEWVDFGWFGGLARMILQVLSFFYSLVKNWGISIILLTLFVRLLLFPLVLSSHRSMELMKTLQPEIKKVREKFKKDPQRMNREIMALMKTHKANPLGGCLPMLLQIPIFWALWKALAGSFSLYRSPFVFWIQDLSWKDPYYVLPVLIGALMFVQQSLSPVTLNADMARAMRILPVFIVLFMLNLPSGLTLYVLISSLFGLIQQMGLNRPHTSTVLKLK